MGTELSRMNMNTRITPYIFLLAGCFYLSTVNAQTEDPILSLLNSTEVANSSSTAAISGSGSGDGETSTESTTTSATTTLGDVTVTVLEIITFKVFKVEATLQSDTAFDSAMLDNTTDAYKNVTEGVCDSVVNALNGTIGTAICAVTGVSEITARRRKRNVDRFFRDTLGTLSESRSKRAVGNAQVDYDMHVVSESEDETNFQEEFKTAMESDSVKSSLADSGLTDTGNYTVADSGVTVKSGESVEINGVTLAAPEPEITYKNADPVTDPVTTGTTTTTASGDPIRTVVVLLIGSLFFK